MEFENNYYVNDWIRQNLQCILYLGQIFCEAVGIFIILICLSTDIVLVVKEENILDNTWTKCSNSESRTWTSFASRWDIVRRPHRQHCGISSKNVKPAFSHDARSDKHQE